MCRVREARRLSGISTTTEVMSRKNEEFPALQMWSNCVSLFPAGLVPCTTWHLRHLYYSQYSIPHTDFQPKLCITCLSIFCTLPPSLRHRHTSSSALCRAPIVSSWTLSALDASKLPLFSATLRLLLYVDPAMLCFVSQLEDGQDSPRGAVTERRLIKPLHGYRND